MFSLTVLDHVRLDSEHVARNYTVHAGAADRLAMWAFAAHIVLMMLMAAAIAAAVANLLLPQRYYQVAAVIATVGATIGFSLQSVLGFENRVAAHRALAHRLWLVASRYRSLIAEAGEGLIDVPTLLQRRDELIADLHAIYERGFGVDHRAFERERLAPLPAERAA
jgi:hypothetical protein